MEEKRLIAVPESLWEKIEKNRGDLSRAEFIDLAIESQLRQEVIRDEELNREKSRAEARKARIEEIKQAIDSLLQEEEPRSKELGKEMEEIRKIKAEAIRGVVSAPLERLERIKGLARWFEKKRGRKELNLLLEEIRGLEERPKCGEEVVAPPVAERKLPEVKPLLKVEEKPPEKEKEKPPEEKHGLFTNTLGLLWIPALILFLFGDIATSWPALAAGGKEWNPLLSLAIGIGGGGVPSLILFTLVQIAVTGVLLWISYRMKDRVDSIAYGIPLLMVFVGAILISNNIMTIIR